MIDHNIDDSMHIDHEPLTHNVESAKKWKTYSQSVDIKLILLWKHFN